MLVELVLHEDVGEVLDILVAIFGVFLYFAQQLFDDLTFHLALEFEV
jgi:hypothetical protein